MMYCWFACDVTAAMLMVKKKAFSPLGTKHHFHVNSSRKKILLYWPTHGCLVTWLQTKSTFSWIMQQSHQWTTGYPPSLLNTHWASGERLGRIIHLPYSFLSIALQHYVGQLYLFLMSFRFQTRAYSLLHSVCFIFRACFLVACLVPQLFIFGE